MSDEFVPHFHYTLKQLAADWEDCTRCELGQRRAELSLRTVVGEGRTRGIMLIGEGPGKTEEATGRPFYGTSGEILRNTLKHLHLQDICYFTNIVACRACVHRCDKDGNPMFERKRGKEPQAPIWEDVPPTIPQMRACAPRIYQEIYKVDPVLIVTLGAVATEFLTKSSITITKDDKPRTIHIPGATYLPVLTEKKQVWVRKQGGKLIAPVVQRQVEYLGIPAVHPAWVLRSASEGEEAGPDSPTTKLVNSLVFAKEIYKRYQIECHGEFSARGAIDEQEDSEH